ncbi:cell division protein PerM [Kitasatospora sp. KL5]|uniref:cell division protein PerM n=1 Tax=Kitasatospora sp. KL5 TaxID=3425125 RepID=UPI003D6E4665
MTQLMGRPILALPDDLGSRSPFADLLAGARTALLALSVIAVPVLGLWVLTPYADVTAHGALRLSCALWLLGHGAPLTRGPGGAPLTLTPLLLTAVSLALLRRAGARAAARTPQGPGAWRSVLSLGAGYLTVAALAVAECSGTEAVLQAEPLTDLPAVAGVAAAGLAWGHWSTHGMTRPALPAAAADRLRRWETAEWAPPAGAAAVLRRTAGAWLLGLLAAGGLLLTAAVALGTAGRSATGLADGPAGILGLLLACTLLLPNALLWAAAYGLGPGFAVGTGTTVSPLGTQLGAVPEFPLFALLPAGSPGIAWQAVLGALPLLAGAVPALLLGRAAAGRSTARPWPPAAVAVVALAAVLAAAAAAGAAAWLAGGALAAGRMSTLGPVPWRVALTAAGWSALVVPPGALLTRWTLSRTAPRPRAAATVRLRTAQLRATLHRLVTRLAAHPRPADD